MGHGYGLDEQTELRTFIITVKLISLLHLLDESFDSVQVFGKIGFTEEAEITGACYIYS